MTFDSLLPYAPHFHSAFSFGLILKGRTCLSLGTERYIAEKGDMVFIDPGRVHSCNPVAGDARSYCMMYIDAAWLHDLLTPLCGANAAVARPVIKGSALFDAALSMLSQTADETCAAGPALRELLLTIQNTHGCFASARPGGADEPMQFFRHISPDALHEERLPVAELADAAGLCRESFSRSFRKRCDLPPGNYLHCLRLEYGRTLLRQGKSIAEAATASGYVDQSHFHRMFVKFYSVTPGLYRKNNAAGHIRTRNMF